MESFLSESNQLKTQKELLPFEAQAALCISDRLLALGNGAQHIARHAAASGQERISQHAQGEEACRHADPMKLQKHTGHAAAVSLNGLQPTNF